MLVKPSQLEGQREELEALRNELDQKGILHDSRVQNLLELTYKSYNQIFYNSFIARLKAIIEAYDTDAKRKPDEFRPYCPPAMNSGNLHIINQADGLPIFIDHNKPVTGLGIFGPQGSGKSYEIIDLCNKIHQVDPDIKITIIDPKGGFSNLKGFLHIDLINASFNFMPHLNSKLEPFVYELIPIIAHSCGLIYGLELLNQAADLALAQRQQYIDQTGIESELCLNDFLHALKSIKVKSFRQTGYHDAAVTALSLIIGRLDLFKCRKGISLDWLFSQNAVLNAPCLTDEMQCSFFATYLLYWLYQRARYSGRSNSLKHVVIIDDATRFIGSQGTQFDGQIRTSPLGHILAVLRESGVCLAYATQLPGQVDPAVLSLTRNALVIGNINGESNLDVIKNMMSLTDEQKAVIPRFKQRQTLAFISGHDWPYPIHGWTPEVNIEEYTISNPLQANIDIVLWHPLTEIPQSQKPCDQALEKESNEKVETEQNEHKTNDGFQANLDTLVYDCILCPFDKVGIRTKRLNMPGSVYERVMNEAVQKGLLLRSSAGQRIYLIPTKLAYEKYAQKSPYQRSVSIEHSFYVSLIENFLKKDVTLAKVSTEVPIGSKGATIDVVATDKSGIMTAYELTLSTSNLLSNASKLQDTAYEKIVWLCRDAATSKAVKAYFNKTRSLPEELVSKFEFLHLSKLLQTRKGRK